MSWASGRCLELAVVTLIVYFILVVLVFLFATQNMETVPVHLIAGRPFEVPLIVVVGMSFFAGFAAAIFGVVLRALKGGKTKTGSSVTNVRRGF